VAIQRPGRSPTPRIVVFGIRRRWQTVVTVYERLAVGDTAIVGRHRRYRDRGAVVLPEDMFMSFAGMSQVRRRVASPDPSGVVPVRGTSIIRSR